MKKISWEIIAAGLLFVGLSIYLIGRPSESDRNPDSQYAGSAINDELRTMEELEKTMVIKLENLEQLKNDSAFSELEKLNELEKLEKLKNLMAFLPAEIKDEIQMNINMTIDEIESESSDVQIQIKNGELILKPRETSTSGFWVMEKAGVYSHSETIEGSAIDFADLELPFGSVEVIGSDTEKPEIQITASGDFRTAAELEKLIKTQISTSEGTFNYMVSSISDSAPDPNIQLQTVLTIPRRTDIKTTTKAGHIQVQGVAGDHKLHTDAGHITLSDLTGTVDASSRGGHVKAFNTNGKALLTTKGGHVSLAESDCEATMQTNGGNIWIEKVTGPVDASTNAGNISIKQVQLLKPITANTNAGNVDILISPDQAFNVELNGRSVELSPEFGFNVKKASGNFTGNVNGGGPLIKTSTGYGTISLKKYE